MEIPGRRPLNVVCGIRGPCQVCAVTARSAAVQKLGARWCTFALSFEPENRKTERNSCFAAARTPSPWPCAHRRDTAARQSTQRSQSRPLQHPLTTWRSPPRYIYQAGSVTQCTRFGGTYTKIGTIQRRLAWPLRKDDTQNREAFHIFDLPISWLPFVVCWHSFWEPLQWGPFHR